MSEPFLSEIRMFSFNFPPKGWAFCNGQLLPINQNQALFALLGTTYGGNGQTNFALPNLRGRVAMHFGAGFSLGQAGGATAHTVSVNELPQHVHGLEAAGNGTAETRIPGNTALLGPAANAYAPASAGALTALSPQAVTSIGGSQPHNNMQPYTVMNYCIALQGIFPSMN